MTPQEMKALDTAGLDEKVRITMAEIRRNLSRLYGAAHEDIQALLSAFCERFEARMRDRGWPHHPNEAPSLMQPNGRRGLDFHPQEVIALTCEAAREALQRPWTQLVGRFWGDKS